MEIKINNNIKIYQKYNPYELSSIMPINSLKQYDNDFITAKMFGYNPTKIYIEGKWYDAIPLHELVRLRNEDGYYRFIYIQINMVNGEYYIGKVNRNKWKIVEKYQGSGVLFRRKYKNHSDEFVRYYIASCKTKKECENVEQQIVNKELIKDEKCLNLTIGGGGTSDHCDEQKRINQRNYMLSHPENFVSMVKKAKELYCIGDSFHLQKRNASIKRTMNEDKYKEMTSKRIKKWKEEHPEEYAKARENNRVSMQSEDTRKKKREARNKWVAEHPDEYIIIRKKSAEGNKKPESRKKHSESIKKWIENNPEQAKLNLEKRSLASVESCRKPVNMCDLSTGKVIKTFNSQHDAARYLVDNGLAKNMNCVSSINAVCIKRPCTSGYGYHKQAYGYSWNYANDNV